MRVLILFCLMAMGLDIKSYILYTSTEALIFTSDEFSFYRCTKFYVKVMVYFQPNFILCHALVKAIYIFNMKPY